MRQTKKRAISFCALQMRTVIRQRLRTEIGYSPAQFQAAIYGFTQNTLTISTQANNKGWLVQQVIKEDGKFFESCSKHCKCLRCLSPPQPMVFFSLLTRELAIHFYQNKFTRIPDVRQEGMNE